MAVLGDSDSHSYHDSILLTDPADRGGTHRATTFQWTEIWARLRPDEVDLGSWGRWGTRGRIAALARRLGFEGRAPRKQDYRFNYAISGAECEHLTGTLAPQTQPLVQRMRRDPETWARGVVVIRMGVNSVGKVPHLDVYAQAGATRSARETVLACAAHVEDALNRIRAAHQTVRVVLVGILNNADWVRYHDRWHDPTALANIAAVLDVFDDRLRALASRDPHAAFLDDREWFRGLWGSRGPDGRPAYRDVSLGGPVSVTNTMGDEPRHAVVQDGHFGTAANGLWLRALVTLIESRWSLGLTPPSAAEIAGLADPDGRYGIGVGAR